VQNIESIVQVLSKPEIVHTPLPEEVRGIYWTAITAGGSRANELLSYMEQTGLNAVVIDTKMDNGQLTFAPHDAELVPYAMTKPAIKDLDGLLKLLAEHHVYRIARIPVMRDSTFARAQASSALRYTSGALWVDSSGSAWLDPTSVEMIRYAQALAKEVYARGFDEVQFDYVRFPSDGSLSSIVYPTYDRTELKVDAMARFFQEIGEFMKQEQIPTSFDVFGLVCLATDGIGIGQRLQDVLAYGDFVSPMVYPSHYAKGFIGLANPAQYPYEVVKYSLDGCMQPIKEIDNVISEEQDSLRRKKQLRPWIQDFDIGALYTSAMIEAQIKAVRDAGGSGFLLWNARNVYEPATYQ